jgi:hypothetical protein
LTKQIDGFSASPSFLLCFATDQKGKEKEREAGTHSNGRVLDVLQKAETWKKCFPTAPNTVQEETEADA